MLLLENEKTILDFETWINEKANESPMFHYWNMIFGLQVLILQFTPSERQRNFDLYVHVLNSSVKYIFALNHYNYARWLDLLKLEYTRPDVYKEFCIGHFVIIKTENLFSSIAIHQCCYKKSRKCCWVALPGQGCSSTMIGNSRSLTG